MTREWEQPPPSSDQYATWDAAYVLGSLCAAERREFEGHLRTCPRCHAAVGDLAGMPGILGQLTHDDVESIDELSTRGAAIPPVPPIRPEVLDTLLDTVRRRRHRARLLAWTGGCAAAAAVAIGIFLTLGPTTAPAPLPQAAAPAVSMAPVKPSPVTATVRLVGHSWGTAIEMNCTYGAEPAAADQDDDVDTLAMVAVGRDGSRAQLATWIARTGVLASPTGSTSLPIDEIASVQVISADTGDILLQRSP